MAAAHGGVVAGAPADAARRDRGAAVGSYITAAGGRGLRNVSDVVSDDRRGEGVHGHGLACRTRAAVLVRAGHRVGGGARRADRDAGGGRLGAPEVGECAGGGQRGALTEVDGAVAGDSDVHRVASRGEALLLAVTRSRAVCGVSPHIVGGVGSKSRDAARERAGAGTVGGVVAAHGGVVASAPADTARRDRGAAVGGDVAAASCRDCRNGRNAIRRNCRGEGVHGHGLACRSRAAVLVRAGHRVGGGARRADCDGSRGLLGAPEVGDCAGGGQRGALTVVDGTVAGDSDVHRFASRGEALLLAVIGSRAVCGVSPHIVGGVGRKSRDAAGERARAAAVGGVAAAHGRVVTGAPADAARRDRGAAVGGDVAAASCGVDGDIGDVVSDDRRDEGVHGHGLACRSRAAVLVRAGHRVGGGALRADCDGSRGRLGAPDVGDCAGGGQRGVLTVVNGAVAGDSDVHRVALRSEALLLTVTRARAVCGVSPHIVGGVGRKSCDVAGERAGAGTVGGVAAVHGRVVAGAPADAARRDRRAAVGGDVAAASCRDCRNGRNAIRRNCRGEGVHSHGLACRSRAAVLVRAGHRVGGGARRADCDGSRGRLGAPDVGDCAGGCQRGALTEVDGTVAGDSDVHRVALRGEALLFTVTRSHIVRRVSPHIVGGVWSKSRDAARERAGAGTIGGVAAAHGGVVASAPADAARRDRGAAVGGDNTATSGRGLRDVSDVVSDDRRGEGVHGHGLACRSRAAVLVRAGHRVGGGARRADRDAGGGRLGAPEVGDCAGGGQCGALTEVDGTVAGDRDVHRVALRGEALLLAVVRACAVRGVSPHIVGGVGRKSCDAAGERACAAAIGGVVVSNGRRASGVPADAARRDCGAAVGGDVAAASCRDCRNGRNAIRRDCRDEGVHGHGYGGVCRATAAPNSRYRIGSAFIQREVVGIRG